MNPVHVGAGVRSWPGLDDTFRETTAELSNAATVRFRTHVAETLHDIRGKPCSVGQPVLIKPEYGRKLVRFAKAYHNAVETIVRAWSTDDAVRRMLSAPTSLQHDMELDYNAANNHIHLCRLDLHLDPAGGFQVLETNANCPGALMSSGHAGALWREFLSPLGMPIPAPLDHELTGWMARWFIELATIETGSPPDFVALLRESGGNRLELPGLASELKRAGIDALEMDPRTVKQTPTGEAIVNGQRIRHGYLKLGIKRFARMRVDIDPFMSAVRRRTIFVQNGLHGRFVGDNKLCLAILSDPTFRYLFPDKILDAIGDHIPWSRGLAHCVDADIKHIRRNRSAFVLKRPFDTRGRGVIVGRGVATDSAWADAVERARRAGWLVQQFVETTELETDPFGNDTRRHDLSLGLINGKLSGAFARSGNDLRLNLARSGRLHPVFIEL